MSGHVPSWVQTLDDQNLPVPYYDQEFLQRQSIENLRAIATLWNIMTFGQLKDDLVNQIFRHDNNEEDYREQDEIDAREQQRDTTISKAKPKPKKKDKAKAKKKAKAKHAASKSAAAAAAITTNNNLLATTAGANKKAKASISSNRDPRGWSKLEEP